MRAFEGARVTLALSALSALALFSCVEPLTESGRKCPCTGSWVCSDFYPQTCVPRADACTPPPFIPVDSGVANEGDSEACDVGDDSGQVTLIDDLEDGDTNIGGSGGVQGTWVESHDKTEGCRLFYVAPIPGGRCRSQYAARLTMAGLSDWGANIGFSLDAAAGTNGTVDEPFDASPYTGIQFWAKSGTKPFSFQFKVVDVSGDPAGGICTADAGSTDPRACYVPFLDSKPADATWRLYRIPIGQLMRATPLTGASGPAKPELTQVFQLLWGIPPDPQPGQWDQFDLWIDDVAWYR
jgi:hypothetical protein